MIATVCADVAKIGWSRRLPITREKAIYELLAVAANIVLRQHCQTSCTKIYQEKY